MSERPHSLEAKESKIDGKGLFAFKDIVAGDIIQILTGSLVTGLEASQMVDRNEYRLGDEVQIEMDLFLIPDQDSLYVNHSCDPNAGIRSQLEMFALRDIKNGEEITFDYSTTIGANQEESWPETFNNLTWTMECNCGAENCRDKIGNVSTIPKEALKRYIEFGALLDFIKHQIFEYKLLE